MAINFPAWTGDGSVVPGAGSPVPAEAVERACQLLFCRVCLIKLEDLLRAAGKWAKGESMTAREIVLLTEEFSDGRYGVTYPSQTPTLQQVQQWKDAWVEPRQMEIHQALGSARRVMPAAWLGMVNLRTLIV